MFESTYAVPASPLLFQLCAAYPDHDEYWGEFIRRFNPLLVSCVIATWRKYGHGNWIPEDLADDLVQETYTTILKNNVRLLRNFRGETEAEAQSYLAQTAINQTLSYLRGRASIKRTATEISLERLIEDEGEAQLPGSGYNSPKSLTEREFLEVLRHLFSGANAERDILVLMLYARDGFSYLEIASLKICNLRESSIANLLVQMKSKLRKYLAGAL